MGKRMENRRKGCGNDEEGLKENKGKAQEERERNEERREEQAGVRRKVKEEE